MKLPVIIEEEAIKTREAARHLNKSPRTIQAWAKEGKLPGIKIGRDYEFSKHLIEEIKKRGLEEGKKEWERVKSERRNE